MTLFIDVKPDNILVDWTYDEQGNHKVDKVALGDFDLALKLINEQPLRAPYAVGNAMWRSPEGQSGKGVAKPSDVYSFGLVVSGQHDRESLTMDIADSYHRSASLALEVVPC